MKTLTTLDRLKIHELVDDLVDHGFAPALNCLNGHKHIWQWEIANRDFLYSIDCVICCGVTRVVVIPENFDWVLKFNFQNEELLQDYNRLEVQHFEKAIEKGLDKYFAAIYQVGAIDGLMVYAQEKVVADEDYVTSSFFQYTLDKYYNHIEYDDMYEDARNDAAWEEANTLDTEDRIYALINDGMADQLIDFIYENDINDLHSGNWGYRGTEPVMIDYAGY